MHPLRARPVASALLALLLAGCGDDRSGTDADADGWTVEDGDCDDQDPSIHPEADEVVGDGIDQDCDGYDNCYRDEDHDGYGTPDMVTSSDGECTSYGESLVSTDCDDDDPAAYPGAEEIVADGVDQDCDSGDLCYLDGDGDLYGTSATVGSSDLDCVDEGESPFGNDCDDEDPARKPGAFETWYDGVDQDCDGNDTDADGDGYPWEGAGGDDCDDQDPDVHPGAEEVCGNGVDDDCHGGDKECPVSLAEADAVFLGAHEEAWAGWWVAPAGDFDGDGHLDVAIASPFQNPSGDTYEGRVQVMTGPFSGEYDLEEAGIVLAGDASNYNIAGYGLAGGLDTNGDGIGAVLVGAGYDDVDAPGWAFLVEGPVWGEIALADADCIVEGEMRNAFAGRHLAAGGDVTGDGVDDWLVGAHGTDYGGVNWKGAVYLVSGTKRGTWSLADVDATMVGEREGDRAGWGVSIVGDVDGDGVEDVLVGAVGAPKYTYRGAAYLLYGPISGTVGLEDADAKFWGEHEGDWLGVDNAPAGDMDDDGLTDIVIAADLASLIYLFHGPMTGEVPLSDAAGVLTEGTTDGVGWAIDSGDDVDGDGHPDILIGSPNEEEVAGAAWLVYGPVVGKHDLKDVGEEGLPGVKFMGARAHSSAGWSLSFVGDIDEDGLDDFLVGAPRADAGVELDVGAAYLVYGRAR